MFGRCNHRLYKVLQSRTEGQGKVVHALFWDLCDLQLRAYLAYPPTKNARVKVGTEGLLSAAVFVGSVGLVLVEGSVQRLFFGLDWG